MIKLNQEVRICSHRTGRQRYNGQVGIIIGTESTCLECNDNAFWVVRIGTECMAYLEDELNSLEDEREQIKWSAKGLERIQNRLLSKFTDLYDCAPVEKGNINQLVTWDVISEITEGWRPNG